MFATHLLTGISSKSYALFAKLSNSSMRSVVVVGRSSCSVVGDCECADVLCLYFGIEKTDDVCIANPWASFSDILDKPACDNGHG